MSRRSWWHQVTKMLCWFRTRTLILYLGLAVALALLLNHELVNKATLDYFSDVPNYVIQFATGHEALDPVRFRQAVQYYKTFDRMLPDSSEVLSCLGYCYFFSGQDQKAVAYLQKAVANEPNRFGFLYNLGMAHYRMGAYRAAVADFKRAVAIPVAEKDFFQLVVIPFENQLAGTILDKKERRLAAIKKNYELAYHYLTLCSQKLGLENLALHAKIQEDQMTQNQQQWQGCELQDPQQLFFFPPARVVTTKGNRVSKSFKF